MANYYKMDKVALHKNIKIEIGMLQHHECIIIIDSKI